MNEITLNKMSKMKLFGMLNSFKTTIQTGGNHSLTNDQVVSILIQAEWEDRENRRLNRYLKIARFRYQASVEEIDFSAQRNLDKNLIIRLADCSFIQRKENILITGSTGAGKSYIATALGHQACLKGFRVLYFNAQKLFPRLKMLKADGTYLKEINRIAKHDLLILDDFGLQKLDSYSRSALLEIMEDRHAVKSTIISSQLPIDKWYELIGESTVADAILDRMINTAHRINLKGESMRKKRKVQK